MTERVDLKSELPDLFAQQPFASERANDAHTLVGNDESQQFVIEISVFDEHRVRADLSLLRREIELTPDVSIKVTLPGVSNYPARIR